MAIVNAEKTENRRTHETWKITFSENITSYSKSELLDYCAKISFLWNTCITPLNDNTVLYTGYID